MKKHLSNQTRKRMLSILGMLLLSVPFVLAQVLVKGTVKDNLGEGVPGASVQVKGTSQGTLTVNSLLTSPKRTLPWLFPLSATSP